MVLLGLDELLEVLLQSLRRLRLRRELASEVVGFCSRGLGARDGGAGPVEEVDVRVRVRGQGELAKLLVDPGDGFADGDGEFGGGDGGDEFDVVVRPVFFGFLTVLDFLGFCGRGFGPLLKEGGA